MIQDQDPKRLGDLELPKKSRVVCLYRGDEWLVPDEDMRLAPGDEVVIITAARNIERLGERWGS